jgi:hypothetical protein
MRKRKSLQMLRIHEQQDERRNTEPDQLPLVRDELDVQGDLVPLVGQRIIELDCGNARKARRLVLRHAGSQVEGLEMAAVQHPKNVSSPQVRLFFRGRQRRGRAVPRSRL